MDLFSNLQLLHEAAISVLVTTTYGRWRGTTTTIIKFVCCVVSAFPVQLNENSEK